MLSHRQLWLLFFFLIVPWFAFGGSADDPATVAYRVSTSEVRVTFFTTDSSDRPVDPIGEGDFAVIDDDMVVRDFRSLMRSDETALDLVILVDTSESVANRLHSVMKDVVSLIRQSPSDSRVSVLLFSGLQSALLCSDDCGSQEATQKLLATQASGLTPLYDALASSAEFIARRRAPGARPVALLFSDGDDTISRSSARDALQALIASGALLYAVDLNVIGTAEKKKSGDYLHGSSTLQWMAQTTGGRYFSAREGAANALQAALDDLRASYVVTYALPRRSVGFHSLRILPRHNATLQFHCRSGYYYGTSVP